MIRLISLGAVATVAVGLYFIGFGQRPPGPPLKPFSVLGALDFGFSFLGAVVPVHFVALPLGVAVAVPVVYLLATFRRRLKDSMFYFFLFLLSVDLGADSVVDPVGPKTGDKRTVRGGSWAYGADVNRAAMRCPADLERPNPRDGFRVALYLD